MNYLNFIESKKHLLGSFGFEPTYYPDISFDFQKEIIKKAVLKGRIAIFGSIVTGKQRVQALIGITGRKECVGGWIS